MGDHMYPARYVNAIDEPVNGIPLRADVRLCFDSFGFVFYPGNDPQVVDRDQKFIAYFVNWRFSYLPDLFHRRHVVINPELPGELLYARFAYAIIDHPPQDVYFDAVPESQMMQEIRQRIRQSEEEEARKRSEGSGGDDDDDDDDDGTCVVALRCSCPLMPAFDRHRHAVRCSRYRLGFLNRSHRLVQRFGEESAEGDDCRPDAF